MSEISRKILFVDDEANVLKGLKRQLRGKFDVTTALSGQAGLRILSGEGSFAVVVADFRMPDMNGVEFLKEAHRVSPESVTLMLTGRAQLDVVVSALHEGYIYRFLGKPCPPEMLEATLVDCIEKYRSAAVERLLNARLSCANEELRLVNESLEKARAEALAANRAKSEFLAKMSHELRTPLNSIIGFTEMMIDDRKDPPNEKRARRLEKVHRNSRNLLALINDILDLSKIEANRLTLDCEEVDVATLITECVESARPLVKNECVKLRQHLDAAITDGFRWMGDAVRLRQIVTNLLSNAAKFTESGHIDVCVRLDRDSLFIEVEDTGIGIRSDHLSAVFDEFEQVDSSSTRRADGTGLGLSICRKLCELMDGEITATSAPGAGSCFCVRLPPREAALCSGASA